jgi:hypothetical protein
MPTSLDTTLELTAADACKSAAVELGAIGTADSLEDSEQEEMVRRLNSMLNSWAVEANIFREMTATAVITGGTGAASLPADVGDVNAVRLVVSATNQRQLLPMNRSQYFQFPNRAQVGTPTMYYYAQGAETDALRIWPVPAADVTLELDYSRRAYAVKAPEETIDVPQEWHETIYLNLASRCASMFGTTRVDPATVQRVDARGAQLYQRMLDADRPDSYFFEPYAGGCGY